MYFKSDNERDHMLVRLSLLALYIIMGYNVVMLVLGYIIAQQNPNAISDTLIRNILFFAAVADMAAIFLVKKSMLGKAIKTLNGPEETIPYKALFNITSIITIMCLAISTYGLVLVYLGEKFEILMLFVALSLVAYQFFRLRARDFEEKFD